MRILILFLSVMACTASQTSTPPATASGQSTVNANATNKDTLVPAAYDAAGKLLKVEKTDAEWRALLNSKEYNVLRQEGTEYAFSGDLWNHHGKGTYTCRGCGLPLFHSNTKFDSGTGWPSYFQPIQAEFVTENKDVSHGMTRVEVECARCGGHLGHVFDDGPNPTGLRYCINSVSLDFMEEK
jgi:peptide-methionine (R)-S-oxide reductase